MVMTFISVLNILRFKVTKVFGTLTYKMFLVGKLSQKLYRLYYNKWHCYYPN